MALLTFQCNAGELVAFLAYFLLPGVNVVSVCVFALLQFLRLEKRVQTLENKLVSHPDMKFFRTQLQRLDPSNKSITWKGLDVSVSVDPRHIMLKDFMKKAQCLLTKPNIQI